MAIDPLALLINARASLDQAITALTPAAPPSIISTPAQFDAALAGSDPVLKLATTFRYPSPLALLRPVTLIAADGVPLTRMTRDEPAPTFLGGIRVRADDVALLGIEVLNSNELTDVIVLSGRNPILDRVRVMGDPVKGQKRGIAANGGNMTIRRSYVAGIKAKGQDSQAVCAWDMERGLTIVDCYLEAAGQAVMLGGADSSDLAHMPTGVMIQSCTLTKDPAWYAEGWQIKCALELKAAADVTVDDCVLEYAGTSQGQGAYLIVATVRNQDGKAPWSAVQRVVVSNCNGAHAGGILTILGSDNNHPSGTLDRFTLRDSAFGQIDPKGITGGSGRLFTFDRGGDNVMVTNVAVDGQNIAALGYFGKPAPKGLHLETLTLPTSKYGWKIDAGKSGLAALRAYAPDAVITNTPL